ncbi:mRNA surveillance protein pelota [Candidatus Woesearchaeota archaeon]|nr:mRNA surveillance protein pelota [Candidatus Woesearchaeota archaeon]
MKVLDSQLKKGIVKIGVENLDDLWYLSQLIDAGDVVKGQTFRKIKLGEGTDRKADVVKKKIFIAIKVEAVEFDTQSSVLRINGTILEGPEDVQRGSYHSLTVEENTSLEIVKEEWLSYQLKKLKEASEQETGNVLVMVMDREEAMLAQMKCYGFEVLAELKGEVEKKAVEVKFSHFYEQLIEVIRDYATRFSARSIILASPAFFKEDLFKLIEDEELKKKIVLATCNHVGKNGIAEVLKRPEVKAVLKQDRTAQEMAIVDEFLAEISRQGAAAYGFREVQAAVVSGAVKMLLVTDTLIRKMREDRTFAELETLMKTADKMQAEVHLISAEHEAGKRLEGLGGIGALLRYKLQY